MTITLSISFLNCVLKGLKLDDTFKGCNACDVWLGSVIMSNPNWCAYFIASKITCDPCPSRIIKC
jgi:hypothetical protein